MQAAREKIVACSICGNVDTVDPCTICRDERRDPSLLVVVETVADLWALERAAALSARYHVLGGTLSPLDGVGPKDLNLASLVERVAPGGVKEVILAVNATVDGQTTAHYITTLLADYNVRTRASRMACRSAANSIISTRARSPPRCMRARRSEARPDAFSSDMRNMARIAPARAGGM